MIVILSNISNIIFENYIIMIMIAIIITTTGISTHL